MPAVAVDSTYTGPSPFLSTLIFNKKWDISQAVTYFIEPVDWDQNGVNDWVQTGAITALRNAYSAWTAVCNLQAVEVGTINQANYVEQVGFPFPGGSSYHAIPANFQGYGSYNVMGSGMSFGIGHGGYVLFLHEVGHGMGLLHPHSDPSFPGVTGEQDPGDFDLNNILYSVMSYIPPDDLVGNTRNSTWGNVAGPMAFDIAAIQAMYGANMTVATGNTTYDIPTANAAGTFWSCIWDAGGTDTLRYTGTADCTLDLRAATLANEPGGGGWISRASGIDGGFTIANNVVIENATGGSGADTITGNDAANTIIGNGGNDVIRGEGGADVLSGNAGADVFVFHRVSDSTASGRDRITDFSVGTDRLDLTLLAATGYSVSQAAGITTLTVVAAQGTLEIQFNGLFTLNQLLPVRVTPQTGDASANILNGTAATDHVFGFDGADTIDGGDNDDLLVGGIGSDQLAGGAGNDTLHGGTGQDGLIDPDGADLLMGGAGADRLYGELGDDRLLGGDGNDELWGGAGDDVLDPGNGFEKVDGGTGQDILVLSDASATSGWTVNAASANGFLLRTGARIDFNSIEAMQLVLGSGDDQVFLPFRGDNVVYAGGGNDQIYGGFRSDTISGGDGNDLIDGSIGADWLDGGAGDDTFRVNDIADVVVEGLNGGTDTVQASGSFYLSANVENLVLVNGAGNLFGVGNELANLINGNDGANLLLGGLGDDTLNGGGGVDSLFGEDGADILNGDAGIDYLVGGIGNDTLRGGADADALYGEDGDDHLDGGASFDTDILVGGAGNDTLNGISGQANPDYDLMDGGSGDDIYRVDTGADLTYEAVGGGIDTVYANVTVPNAGVYLYANVENLVLEGTTAFGVGNELDNQLTGSASGNWLLGGLGADTINGGEGNDVLFGEGGADVFVFGANSGADVIGDFAAGTDRIQLNGLFADFASLSANFAQVGNDGAIYLPDGNLIVLHGVTMAALTAADFIFAPVAEVLSVTDKTPAVMDRPDWIDEPAGTLYAEPLLADPAELGLSRWGDPLPGQNWAFV